MPYYGRDTFDPAFIVAQIVALQALLYMSLGAWLLMLSKMTGSPPGGLGLEHFFSSTQFGFGVSGGWLCLVAFTLNAGCGGCFLCLLVERAKKCLDFAATAHLLHLAACAMYGGFPGTWEWWTVNVLSLVVMVLCGECAQPIPAARPRRALPSHRRHRSPAPTAATAAVSLQVPLHAARDGGDPSVRLGRQGPKWLSGGAATRRRARDE